METTEQSLLHQASGEIKAFAPGWGKRRLIEEIRHICQFAAANSEKGIPLDLRRRISRRARSLQELIEIAGIGLGAGEDVFLSILRNLGTLDWFIHLPGNVQQSQSRRGGDRRSGRRSLEGIVLGDIVRLYCEANASAGFSPDGPLVRFANTVGELALGHAKPFTSDAVKAEFRRMKRKAKRTASGRVLYKRDDGRRE